MSFESPSNFTHQIKRHLGSVKKGTKRAGSTRSKSKGRASQSGAATLSPAQFRGHAPSPEPREEPRAGPADAPTVALESRGRRVRGPAAQGRASAAARPDRDPRGRGRGPRQSTQAAGRPRGAAEEPRDHAGRAGRVCVRPGSRICREGVTQAANAVAPITPPTPGLAPHTPCKTEGGVPRTPGPHIGSRTRSSPRAAAPVATSAVGPGGPRAAADPPARLCPASCRPNALWAGQQEPRTATRWELDAGPRSRACLVAGTSHEGGDVGGGRAEGPGPWGRGRGPGRGRGHRAPSCHV